MKDCPHPPTPVICLTYVSYYLPLFTLLPLSTSLLPSTPFTSTFKFIPPVLPEGFFVHCRVLFRSHPHSTPPVSTSQTLFVQLFPCRPRFQDSVFIQTK